MATFNGAPYIRASINSLLSQTWRDFELIVVDDCSTDSTPDILRSIRDPRLLVFRNETNLGVVESRNRCFAEASGRYIALQDHDDLSRPTRLAKQVAFLDGNPDVALLAAAAHTLEAGRMTPPRRPTRSSPALLDWLLLVANPLICSSVMFRADAARRLEQFMRPDFTYADDFDFYHRIRPYGRIARLDEPLAVYRLHNTNASRTHEDLMAGNAVRVLIPAYEPLFGSAAASAAAVVQQHLSMLQPVRDSVTLDLLQSNLRRLTNHIVDSGIAESDRLLILNHAEALWQRALGTARRQSGLSIGPAYRTLYLPDRRSAVQRANALLDRVPFRQSVRRLTRGLLARTPAKPRSLPSNRLGQFRLTPVQPAEADPPTLFVVVDTEAEFDWKGPFDRSHTNVGAIEHLERGQEVFDRFGLRPVYVVDYPIASTPSSVARLRRILDRGGCEIGAHLHPWTTPPYDEPMSERNSYPGNLAPRLERAKLANLNRQIEHSFGSKPLFYKAGRYGFGPSTAEILAEEGIQVDFSILPGADLRWNGGPDFRGLHPVTYLTADNGVVAIPMTRSTIGIMPGLGRWLEYVSQVPLIRLVPLRPVMARLRIADTITLTPEGVTTAEQIRLIRTMLARGVRRFVLHYHSPSLQAGNTSYTSSEAAVVRFLASLDEVCRFFFEQVGGLPGYPRDLLPEPGRLPPVPLDAAMPNQLILPERGYAVQRAR